ncbi:MAG TPA: hypothetical protein VK477_11415, partial [Acidobacteriota bacterium]|nr:hypothetical protein [Acidobacteriota bacterium]
MKIFSILLALLALVPALRAAESEADAAWAAYEAVRQSRPSGQPAAENSLEAQQWFEQRALKLREL